MVLALSDSWAQLLVVFGPLLVAALGFGGKVLLTWLRKQAWVQKMHLEQFFTTMVPEVIQWVESWEKLQDEKPTPEAKAAKFKELLKSNLPKGADISDEELALRAETELRKLKAGVPGAE